MYAIRWYRTTGCLLYMQASTDSDIIMKSKRLQLGCVSQPGNSYSHSYTCSPQKRIGCMHASGQSRGQRRLYIWSISFFFLFNYTAPDSLAKYGTACLRKCIRIRRITGIGSHRRPIPVCGLIAYGCGYRSLQLVYTSVYVSPINKQSKNQAH